MATLLCHTAAAARGDLLRRPRSRRRRFFRPLQVAERQLVHFADDFCVCTCRRFETRPWDALGCLCIRVEVHVEVAGVDAGNELGTDMVLNIGPQHPSTHGVLRLRLVLDGERVIRCEPIVGYMHRGAEKLFEVRDYRQIIMLANRHDWLSAFSNELGVVLAVERMMGLEVPERAVWIRTLAASPSWSSSPSWLSRHWATACRPSSRA